MFSRVKTILTSTKKPTKLSTIITLTVFFYTMSFLTFTSFFNFFDFDSKTESLFCFIDVLAILLILESSSISCQSWNYSLFMLFSILMCISTIIAFTILSAIKLFLETFAIKFQTFRSFTIAPKRFFLCLHHSFLFSIFRR